MNGVSEMARDRANVPPYGFASTIAVRERQISNDSCCSTVVVRWFVHHCWPESSSEQSGTGSAPYRSDHTDMKPITITFLLGSTLLHVTDATALLHATAKRVPGKRT